MWKRQLLFAFGFYAWTWFATATISATPPQGALCQMQTELLEQVNAHRTAEKLPPLACWDILTLCAQQHSENMAAGYIPVGHAGFEKRSALIRQHAPHIALGENVAYNRGKKDPLKAALTGWLKSPAHCAHILGPFQLTGIGIAFDAQGGCYLTQIFARQRNR